MLLSLPITATDVVQVVHSVCHFTHYHYSTFHLCLYSFYFSFFFLLCFFFISTVIAMYNIPFSSSFFSLSPLSICLVLCLPHFTFFSFRFLYFPCWNPFSYDEKGRLPSNIELNGIETVAGWCLNGNEGFSFRSIQFKSKLLKIANGDEQGENKWIKCENY